MPSIFWKGIKLVVYYTDNLIFDTNEKGKLIMAEGIFEIDDSSFETEVLKSDKPVLVDFWAPWCGPCRAMAPILEELAGSFGDKIKIMKCNVDDNPATPSQYEIRSIPTLLFFKDGKVEEQIIGITAKSNLEETINKLL